MMKRILAIGATALLSMTALAAADPVQPGTQTITIWSGNSARLTITVPTTPNYVEPYALTGQPTVPAMVQEQFGQGPAVWIIK
ncbi:MAG TPA: hypothetical protein VL992_09560 [Tepidisphaeraceae bacterium]|nr:hypothetical protein [Tepidisphaeraceae bacterium]